MLTLFDKQKSDGTKLFHVIVGKKQESDRSRNTLLFTEYDVPDCCMDGKVDFMCPEIGEARKKYDAFWYISDRGFVHGFTSRSDARKLATSLSAKASKSGDRSIYKVVPAIVPVNESFYESNGRVAAPVVRFATIPPFMNDNQ